MTSDNNETPLINSMIDAERRKLGEILLSSTSLTEAQLLEALELQTKEQRPLGEILVSKNLIAPQELLKALCRQLDITYTDDLKPAEIDPDLVKSIPINYAKSKEVIPIASRNEGTQETLVVAVSNPFQLSILEDLRVLTGHSIEVVVSSSARINDAINRVYERANANQMTEIKDEFNESLDLEETIDILDASEDDAPIIRYVNQLIFRAVKERASDIHIEPFEREMVVRLRIDGVLYDIRREPKKVHAAISSRIKVMGSLDIAEKRLPQDGRIKIKLAGKDIDIRLSTIPTAFGERLVMRILEQSGNQVLQLKQLGFEQDALREIERIIHKKHGIILVTGPTGSGKSTTLSASLSILNSPERCIITVEDPIEYQIPGINQIQVNSKIELTFARALRSILRQNPDVIMIGEIRDKETAEIAINASLTGHLVLSTLHTNDAAGASTRLSDMGVEPFLVASSVLGIIAQRLLRKVCTKCREEYKPTPEALAEIGITTERAKGAKFYHAMGCPQCSSSGYSGRTVVYELLLVTDEIRTMMLKNLDAGSIKKKAVEQGMQTLRENGIQKLLAGQTTIEELVRATQADE